MTADDYRVAREFLSVCELNKIRTVAVARRFAAAMILGLEVRKSNPELSVMAIVERLESETSRRRKAK